MELKHYFNLLRRWWWLLLLGTVILGAAAYVYTRSQNAVYQAEVKIFIGGYRLDPDPAAGEIQTGTDLVQTYTNLVRVRPILEATIDTLQLNTTPSSLSTQIFTTTFPNSSILSILVIDTDPLRAADIANELANQLVLNSPTSLTPEQADRRTLFEEEISALADQIVAAREQVEAIDEAQREADAPDPALAVQRHDLIAQITIWQQSMASLTGAMSVLGSQTNQLEIVEPALASSTPLQLPVLRNTMLGAFVGLCLAIGAALALDYLDSSFRSHDEVKQLLPQPLLAGIVRFGRTRETYSDKLISLQNTQSPALEGYRGLRTNLLFHLPETKRRVIISSARASEGKSVTTANLAVMIAKAGHHTVLIDADLHRPQMHNIFKLSNSLGLSDLLKLPLPQVSNLKNEHIQPLLQATAIPQLQVITAGEKVAAPAELLGQAHMRFLCELLEQSGADIILLDSPPLLAVIDGVALASTLNAAMVLVIQANRTRRDAVLRAIEQCTQMNIHIPGVVLNQVNRRTQDYSYYHDYGRYATK